ncbi:hypothetical protein DFQ26_000722, partial [Actinomortierella ambigua]
MGSDANMPNKSDSVSATSAQDASGVTSMTVSADPASHDEPAQTTRSLETFTQGTSNET